MLSQFRKNAAEWSAIFASTHPNNTFAAHYFTALKEKKNREKERRDSTDGTEEGDLYVGEEYYEDGEPDEYENAFYLDDDELEKKADYESSEDGEDEAGCEDLHGKSKAEAGGKSESDARDAEDEKI